MSESQTRLEQKVDLNLLKPKHSLKKSQLSNDLLVVLKASCQMTYWLFLKQE